MRDSAHRAMWNVQLQGWILPEYYAGADDVLG
jgi:hypothetical protein